MASFNLFDVRDAIDFPDGDADNSSDTIIAGYHFNTETLDHFNYTLYDNGTLSNGSRCVLAFEPYQPIFLFPNGTLMNSTSCYNAILPIGTRGFTGIGFAVGFGLALVLSITALAKHGPLHLPFDRRFYPIGRRWQWYWALWVCAFALISLFTNIDIDRYYIQHLPITLSVITYFIMCQGTMALVWEAVRHWGSWQERQFIDPNPFVYRQDDRRANIEFWLPLWCYLWIWMNFFLTIPRNWTFVQMQRSPEQEEKKAIPAALSTRFKAGAFCLVIAWLTICFSLRHSMKHYSARHRGIFNRIRGCLTGVPPRFVLIIPLSLAMVAYQIFISFVWEYSLMNEHGSVPVMFGWGYGPTLAILYIQIIYGWVNPNEDKELLRQRRERGESVDRELGIVKKPAWWRRPKKYESVRDRVLRNVNEVGGQRGVGRREEDDFERHIREDAMNEAVNDDGIELSLLHDPNNPRMDRAGARTMASPGSPPSVGDDFFSVPPPRPGSPGSVATPPPPYRDQGEGRPGQTAERSNSTSTTHSLGSPQQIRSMLDI